MNNVKKELIDLYNINILGYDCMGYILQNGDIYTYHHIDEARNGGNFSLENGAILCGKSSHPYLHLIEKYDRKKFLLITQILIEINKKQKIDQQSIENINTILLEFEKLYSEEEDKYGNLIIKPNYKIRLLTKNIK